MSLKVGEEKVELRKNSRLNQYSTLSVVKAETEEGLAEIIANHESQVFIKAIYYSPTSKKHVAYVLSNETITKE